MRSTTRSRGSPRTRTSSQLRGGQNRLRQRETEQHAKQICGDVSPTSSGCSETGINSDSATRRPSPRAAIPGNGVPSGPGRSRSSSSRPWPAGSSGSGSVPTPPPSSWAAPPSKVQPDPLTGPARLTLHRYRSPHRARHPCLSVHMNSSEPNPARSRRSPTTRAGRSTTSLVRAGRWRDNNSSGKLWQPCLPRRAWCSSMTEPRMKPPRTSGCSTSPIGMAIDGLQCSSCGRIPPSHRASGLSIQPTRSSMSLVSPAAQRSDLRQLPMRRRWCMRPGRSRSILRTSGPC